MPADLRLCADTAVATLTEPERRRSVVYLDVRTHAAGTVLKVGRLSLRFAAASVVAFVDLAPGVNWGHECRYLVIDATSARVDPVDAQFPPPVEHLRLVHRGPQVEDWMLLTSAIL